MSRETELSSSNTWMECMRNGAFEQAWRFSDKVLEAGINRDYQNLPRHFQCIWDGTPLNDKRVLIRCYHGLGDTIQFIRFAPLVKQIAREVMVWAQPPLIELLKTTPSIDQIIPLHDGTPDVPYDVDVEVMELAHVFRSTPATLPVDIPYLHVNPLLFSTNTDRLSVGLVWKAGDWDQARGIPFSCLEPLKNVQSVDLYILQADAVAAGWHEGFGINPGEFSLHDYARVISGLDLLITVDSMPAHMAGALGVPVWTLLHAGADWRWMDDRADSPWYPSMRLFRQKEQGDWRQVIEEVSGELRKMAEAKTNI